MTKTSLLHLRRAPAIPRVLPHSLVRAACSGVLLGLLSTACVVTIHDGGWGDPEACFDEYDDCMDDAENSSEYAACDKTLDACLEGGYGDEAEDDSPPRTDSGDTDSGDTDNPDPACFEIYATCIGEAETLQEVEACEALFDHCANPGECPDCGCPQAELDACLDGYGHCLAYANSEAEADACATEFDTCAAQFDFSQCQPGYDEAVLHACLDQHGLCVACADTPEQLAACSSAFDSCLG